MTRECKYMAIGRYTSGVSVLGYVLQDIDTGETKLLKRSAVEQMALQKQINNVTAQTFDGKIIMKGINCKISTLPNYDSTGNPLDNTNGLKQSLNELNITGRIQNGKSTVGYIITVTTNGIKCAEKRVSREQTLEIAKIGKLSNARVQMSNNELVLRGVGCKLAQLPSIKQSN